MGPTRGYINAQPKNESIKESIGSALSYEHPERFPEHSVPRYAFDIVDTIARKIQKTPDQYDKSEALAATIAAEMNKAISELAAPAPSLIKENLGLFQEKILSSVEYQIRAHGDPDEIVTKNSLTEFKESFCKNDKVNFLLSDNGIEIVTELQKNARNIKDAAREAVSDAKAKIELPEGTMLPEKLHTSFAPIPFAAKLQKSTDLGNRSV